MYTKRVLFFTQARWAFAQIHYGLTKELYAYGIYANLLDWRAEVKPEEWELLNESYDLFVTNPEAVLPLAQCGIPINKIATVAHGQWDMLLAQKECGNLDFYPHLYKFGVVSNVLKTKAKEHAISSRVPDVVTFGIHFDSFYRKPSEKLTKLGYGGAKETFNFFSQEIKRANLISDVIATTPLELVQHNFYNWMAMPGYYSKIDALAVSSIEESAGLPSMEAAAAGRLILSTPVGYFENGKWYLFYERRDLGVWLATSTDMKVWTNVSDEPIIPRDANGVDSVMLAMNQIIKTGDEYVAVLHGTTDPMKPRRWCTYLARSKDLMHWKKEPPLRPVDENKSSGELVYDGTQWLLYTMHDRVDLHRPTARPATSAQ